MSTRPVHLHRPLLLVAAVFVVFVVALGPAATAGAHATVLSLTPSPDSTLERPPTNVELVFDESVTLIEDSIRVFDPAATELPVEITADGPRVVGELDELTLDGSYTVAWKIVSADGHPLSGAYLFHLREATLTEPVDVAGGGASLAADPLRAIGASAALLGAVWVVVGLVRVRRRGERAAPVAAWVLATAGTTAALLGAVLAVGSDLTGSFRAVLDTTSGRSAVAAWVLSVLGLAMAAVGSRSTRTVPVGVVLGVVAAFVVAVASQGHAVSLEPVALSATLTIAHVLAAVVWIAGLVLIERDLRAVDAEGAAQRVRRLSPVAAASAGVLALSGVVLVLDRVPIDELGTSGYGQIALAKSALLVVALGLAARHRFRLAPALVESDRADTARRSLALGVRIEVVVVVLALVAGTVLAQVSPPGTGSGGPAGELDERRAFGGGEVELTVEPALRGTNEVHVIAFEPDGRLMGGIGELELAFSLPSEDLGPLRPEMQFITGGHSVAFPDLPLTGTWEVEVTAPRGDFEELSAQFTLAVGN